jgi:hypothetical protein
MFCPSKMLHSFNLFAVHTELFIYFTIWLSVLLQRFDLLFDTDILEEHAVPHQYGPSPQKSGESMFCRGITSCTLPRE